MPFTGVLTGNLVIGLREGLEASLVVSILVAYLVKAERRDALKKVWAGIAAAVALSVGFGALLTYTSTTLLSRQADQETFGGTLSIVAVGFVTWMVFWMKRAARNMKGELHGKMGTALQMGTGAVIATAFLAVGREGLETALFVWTAVQAATATGESQAQPLVGALIGIAIAVVLAYLLYKRAVTLNLQKFFTYTGYALVVVAAGVLGYGLHDLQEGGVLPGLHSTVWTIPLSSPFNENHFLGTLGKGVFNISSDTTWLQFVAYFVYLVPVLYFFRRKPAAPARPVAPAAAQPDLVRSSAS